MSLWADVLAGLPNLKKRLIRVITGRLGLRLGGLRLLVPVPLRLAVPLPVLRY